MTDHDLRSPVQTNVHRVSPRIAEHSSKLGSKSTEPIALVSPRLTDSLLVRSPKPKANLTESSPGTKENLSVSSPRPKETVSSPRPRENLTSSSPRPKENLTESSPRPRENAVFVIHSISDNINRVSPRTGQTPVEVVLGTGDPVQWHRENRTTTNNVEPQPRGDRQAILAANTDTGRVQGTNNLRVSENGQFVPNSPVDRSERDRQEVRLSQSNGHERNRNRERENHDSRGQFVPISPETDRRTYGHGDSQEDIRLSQTHAQERNRKRERENHDSREQFVPNSPDDISHRVRQEDVRLSERRAQERNRNRENNAFDSRQELVSGTTDRIRQSDVHENRRLPQGHSHDRNLRTRDSYTSRRQLLSDPQAVARRTDRHEERRATQSYTHVSVSQDRSRARRQGSVGTRSVSSGRTRSRSARTTSTEEDEKDERYVVPALPMPVAILCCVLNFIIPGSGSMTASVCVLCCAKTEDMSLKEKCGSCCTVFGIGVLQLLLVACFLIGWVWSCIWGITFIGMSANYYHNEEEEEVANLPAWERNLRGRTPLPLPQVVTTQPYPGIGYDDLRREHERRRRLRQEHQRRARSRISLNAANFIYPMRAPSNLAYHSPPPPYEESTTEIPSYQSLDAIAAGREESRRSGQTGREDRVRVSQMQINEQFRPMNGTIQEEDLT